MRYGLFESKQFLYSSFFFGDVHIHLLHNKANSTTAFIKEFKNNQPFLPVTAPTNFNNLPRAISNDTLYFIISANNFIENIQQNQANQQLFIQGLGIEQVNISDNPLIYSQILKDPGNIE